VPRASSIAIKRSALQGAGSVGNASAIVPPPASVKDRIAAVVQDVHAQYQREWAVKLGGGEGSYGDTAFE
jgi:hypothetical protein